jgi:anti-anti-sigma factor
MEIFRSGEGRAVSITVSGKMDAYWSDALSRELESCVSEGAREITLDLSDVSFISSAGLRVLLIYLKQMKAIKGALHFVNPSDKVRSIFDLSGLTHLLSSALGGTDAAAAIPDVPLPDHTGMYVAVSLREMEAGEIRHFPPPEGGRTTTYPQVRYPSTQMGFGIGAFGDAHSDVEQQFGEYLAAAGITVCVPTDGRNHPDYMIEDGVFVPVISVHSGMSVDAEFSRQLIFEASEQYRGIPLSSLALLALREAETPALAALIVAESASLIGASRKRSPALEGMAYAVSDVREQFSFTTEPSYEHCTTVICALFSATASPVLRPLDPGARCHGHAHAVVFPHRPLPEGEIDPQDVIRSLFDHATVRNVLHMMYDDRNPIRSMESEFLRGSIWIHPLRGIPGQEGPSRASSSSRKVGTDDPAAEEHGVAGGNAC